QTEERLDCGTLEYSLTVASLYDDLHTLKGSERLLDHPMNWSDSFKPIVREQIENRKREQEIATQIALITNIDEEIPTAARAQLVENPYPRWVTMQRSETDTIEELWGRLRPLQDVRIR